MKKAGRLALISKPQTNYDFWLSGLAFSTNPWAHAAQSAVGYNWGLNGGDQVPWWGHWNSDVLAQLTQGSSFLLKVPVIPSGQDKLLYLIQHNDSWNGCMHTGITVNNQPIERFVATYDNPFARHWNSKLYERYIAACIPHAMINDTQLWLDVRIDMSTQVPPVPPDIPYPLYFREIGTHDMNVA